MPNLQQTQSDYNDSVFTWEAPEFKHYEKTGGWYITLAVIAVIVIGFEIIQKDYFGAVCLGILALFIAFFATQRPKMVTISLDAKSLSIDALTIPYKTIRYFWIVNNNHHRTLNLETSTYLNRTIILELGDQDAEAIRNFLGQFIIEHEETEATWSQRIRHRLKF